MYTKIDTLIRLTNAVRMEFGLRNFELLKKHELLPLVTHIVMIDPETREYFHDGSLEIKNISLCTEDCKCGRLYKCFVGIDYTQGHISGNVNTEIVCKTMKVLRKVLDKSGVFDGRSKIDVLQYNQFKKRIRFLNDRIFSLALMSEEIFDALTKDPIFYGTSWDL